MIKNQQISITKENDTLQRKGFDELSAQSSELEAVIASGASGRNRTCDRQLRRLLLYPLSYRGKCGPHYSVLKIKYQENRGGEQGTLLRQGYEGQAWNTEHRTCMLFVV